MPYTFDSLSMLEMQYEVSLATSYPAHTGAPAGVEPRSVARHLLNQMAGLGSTFSTQVDTPPGPASNADAFEAAMASDLAVFEAGERLQGAVDDAQLSALARMYATAVAELDARHAQSWVDRTPLGAAETVTMEVATATGLALNDVRLRLDLAIGSPDRMGFLREQVATGATTLYRACQLVTATRHLPDDLLDLVVRAALAPTRDGAGLPPARFRQRLRRALVAADTATGSETDTRKAARQRIGVFARLYDDGTGCLSVTNDAEKIAAAYDRADAAARAARQGGDPRPLDELRADFLTGAAIAGWPEEHPQSTPPSATECVTPGGPAGFHPTSSAAPSASSGTPPVSEPKADAGGPAPGHPSGGGDCTDPGAEPTYSSPDAGEPGADPADPRADAAEPGADPTDPRADAAEPRGRSAGDDPGGQFTRQTRRADPNRQAREADPDSRAREADLDRHPGTACAEPVPRFGPIGAHPVGKVWIVVPWTTAAGLDDDPCELPGHGWVSAAHAREIITAEGSIWHTMLADVDTGRALRLSRPGYRPTAEMVDHVRAVDGTCRAPGCDVLATRCDIDHSRGFDHHDTGATTSVVELGALHRAHHRVRTAGLWEAVRNDEGHVDWRTAAGRRYVTYPHDWLEHSRETNPVGATAPGATRRGSDTASGEKVAPTRGPGSTTATTTPEQNGTDGQGCATHVPPPF